MRLIAVLIAAAILGLGIWRLTLDFERRSAIDASKAIELANCLRPPSEIPAGATVTLRPLSHKDPKTGDVIPKGIQQLQPAEATDLLFKVVGPVRLELSGELLRAAVAGKPITLTPNQRLTVTKTKGSFEFVLVNASILVSRDNAQFLLKSIDHPVRFGPTDVGSYEITLPQPQDAMITEENNKKYAVLPVDTTGKLTIGLAQSLAPLQPLTASSWLLGTASTLMPVRVSGQPGLADVAIEAKHPGVRFDAPGLSMAACVLDKDGSARPVGVSETKPQLAGARIVLALPEGVLPVAHPAWPPVPVELAIASSDGQYLG